MTSEVEKGFHVADYLLFSMFLMVSLGIGIYHALTGGRQRTIGEYTVANRQMRTIPVAISMFVSVVSGVLVLGHPAEIYTRGGQFVIRAFGHALAGFVAGPLFVPLFFKLRITSAYEVNYDEHCSRTTPCPPRQKKTPLMSDAIAELSMGSFCVTRSNPTIR